MQLSTPKRKQVANETSTEPARASLPSTIAASNSNAPFSHKIAQGHLVKNFYNRKSTWSFAGRKQEIPVLEGGNGKYSSMNCWVVKPAKQGEEIEGSQDDTRDNIVSTDLFNAYSKTLQLPISCQWKQYSVYEYNFLLMSWMAISSTAAH